MNSTEALERLEHARRLLHEVAAGIDNPAVFQAVTVADMNLHWARWQLGTVEEIMPQLETPEGAL